jgi:hypothetical protein
MHASRVSNKQCHVTKHHEKHLIIALSMQHHVTKHREKHLQISEISESTKYIGTFLVSCCVQLNTMPPTMSKHSDILSNQLQMTMDYNTRELNKNHCIQAILMVPAVSQSV